MSDKHAAALRRVGDEQRCLYSPNIQILLLPALIPLNIKYPVPWDLRNQMNKQDKNRLIETAQTDGCQRGES